MKKTKKKARKKKVSRAGLACSFCGKGQEEVKNLIAGPAVYICDECVGLCSDIVGEGIDKSATNDNKGSKRKLDWKYCECGCHGHEVAVGSLYLWLFNDLEKPKAAYTLHKGHGWLSPKIGKFDSFDAADKAGYELAKVELTKMKDELAKAEASIKAGE